jgi:hypothetical protein
MSADVPESLNRILASGRITAEDVRAIRQAIYPDGVIGIMESEWLFALNAACKVQDPAWPILFVEALTDQIVFQSEPQGYVTERDAAWLIARVNQDGHVASTTEMELLVNILEKSQECPAILSNYVLKQVHAAVLTGEGPLRSGRIHVKGLVDAADVELLRRTLYAAGGLSSVAITRAEADVLFDISDATANAANDPAWADLFVKAIANHLMFASGHAVPSREDALRRSRWVDDTRTDVGGFFGRMVKGLSDLGSQYREAGLAALTSEAGSSEAITAAEAEWLAGRLLRDNRLQPHEEALLAFLKHESPSIHPSLQPLIDKVA